MHGCQQGGGGSGGVFVPSGKLLAKREKLEGGGKRLRFVSFWKTLNLWAPMNVCNIIFYLFSYTIHYLLPFQDVIVPQFDNYIQPSASKRVWMELNYELILQIVLAAY